MKGKSIWISVISAAAGAALMLLALGSGGSSGIEGWVPLNEGIAAAMSEQTEQVADKGKNGKAEAADVNAVGGKGEVDPPAAAEAGNIEPIKTEDHAESKPAAEGNSAETPQDQDGKVSINTAGTLELQEIPGIGEKKAQAIVEYRNAHGPFGSVNELTNVKGIGDKLLEKMKPHIRL